MSATTTTSETAELRCLHWGLPAGVTCQGMSDSLGIAGVDVARRVIFKEFEVKFV